MYRIPKHIAIIPDGNRRWAKLNNLNKEDGYSYGLKLGLELLRVAREYGVEELTYYGFTVDNCKRPVEQVKAFSKACVDAVKMIENEETNLYVVGNYYSKCFPRELLPYTKYDRTRDKRKKEMYINFLVNYGWEWDMKNNWLSRNIPRVDLVIRWGGMRRLSGLLPLQTVYSDICIIDELWPDFTKEQFDRAIEWYQKQDITLGG